MQKEALCSDTLSHGVVALTRKVPVVAYTLVSFEDALYQIVREEGPGALTYSWRLLGMVSDLCDNTSTEFRIFERNCDDELLQPFADALRRGANAAILSRAANSVELILESRSIEARAAQHTASCMYRGIARAAGINVPANAHQKIAQNPAPDRPQPMPAAPYAPQQQAEVNHTPTQYAPQPQPVPVMQPRPVPQPVAQPPVQPARKNSSPLVAILSIALVLTLVALVFSLTTRNTSSGTQTGTSSAANTTTSSSKSSTSKSSSIKPKSSTTDNAESSDQSNNSNDTASSNEAPPAPEPIQPTEPEPTPTYTASDFSLTWEGSYDGLTSDETPILRQLIFVFRDVTNEGYLSGTCYVGVIDQVPEATSGSFFIEGTLDFNTGAIHLWQTAWLRQGGLGPEREFMGTVDFSTGTMSGYLSTKGENNFDVAWRCAITDNAEWHTE